MSRVVEGFYTNWLKVIVKIQFFLMWQPIQFMARPPGLPSLYVFGSRNKYGVLEFSVLSSSETFLLDRISF